MNISKFLLCGSSAFALLLGSAIPAAADQLSFGFSYTGCVGTSSPCASEATVTNTKINNVTADYLTYLSLQVTSLVSLGGAGTLGSGFVPLTFAGTGAAQLTMTTTLINGTTYDQFSLGTTGNETIDGVGGSNLLVYDALLSTATGTGAGSVVTFGATTNLVSVNNTLASALGISNGFIVTDSGNQLTLDNANGNSAANGANDVRSATYGLTVTPEPASFALFGTGLACAGLFARRRKVRQVVRV
jgi:hypothetical protein